MTRGAEALDLLRLLQELQVAAKDQPTQLAMALAVANPACLEEADRAGRAAEEQERLARLLEKLRTLIDDWRVTPADIAAFEFDALSEESRPKG